MIDMRAPTVELFVREEGAAHGKSLVYDLLSMGSELGKGLRLSPPQSREVLELARQAAAVFEQRPGKEASEAAMEIMGEALFRLWFGDRWKEVSKDLPTEQDVVIEVVSDVPNVLALPWEMLRLPGQRHRVRRNSGTAQGAQRPAAPAPLRVLIAICSPAELPRLEWDGTEEGIIDSLQGLDLTFHICDQGRFDEIADSCGRLCPHVLHLVGHCGEMGFAFEDEQGRSDWRSAIELAGLLPLGSALLIQGRDFGGLSRLARDLISSQSRAVLAAGASLGEGEGRFLRELYGALSVGQSLEDALQSARPVLADDAGLAWAVPQLYGDGTRRLLDSSRRQEPAREIAVQLPLPGLSGGYAAPFLGRKRMVQRLAPSLREGPLRLLILTGPSGSGRSTLACRLVRGLGHRPLIAIQVPSSGKLLGAALFESCRHAFQSAGSVDLAGLAARMDDADLTLERRMAAAVQGINEGGFVLVVDGLMSGKEADPTLNTFFSLLKNELKEGRAIICADSLPLEAGRLGQSARSEWLGEISDSAFKRYILQDGDVSRRFRQGSLRSSLLQQITSTLGRNPVYLDLVRARLAKADTDDLDLRLKEIVLPADLRSRRVAQEKGFRELFLEEAFASLSVSEGRALARSSAFPVSAPAVELSAAAAFPEGETGRILAMAQSLGLAHPAASGWSVLNHRNFLLGKLEAEEKAEALSIAGEMLAKRRTFAAMLEADLSFALAGKTDLEQEIFRQLAGYLIRHGMQQDLDVLSEGRTDPQSIGMRAASLLQKGDLDAAALQLDAALEGFRKAADRAGEAAMLHNLGSVALRRGQSGQARERFRSAADLLESLGDRAGEASALHNLALAAIQDLEYATARESLEKSRRLLHDIGDRGGEAQSLQTMARIYLAEKQDQQARELLQQALALFQEGGDLEGEASTIDGLAALDIRQERWSEARDRLQKVLEILIRTGNDSGLSATWHNLATVQQQLGDRSQAQMSLRRALEIQRRSGDRAGEAASIFQLGIMAVWESKMQEGLRLLAMAAMILRSTGSPDLKQVEPMVENLAAQLKVTPEQFMNLVGQVVTAYRRDGGQKLIEEVFGPLKDGAD
ncbi:MAG TPA: tetratricopeptide repeat protein [Methanotrichaceae archaeon]|nr:tetratricopeptide repeat protein [Methanotrichaceae archaeon]HQF17253.1 tetratricopeptide repeat protein [Methanotrichaceae archaeon]HQI91826.1 tetratricopeptide repeat protein [Methanotrichaceae archaeon]HQJ29156.1 tetratricopeptide repeat protein [Methanotrichaceae archaeon]